MTGALMHLFTSKHSYDISVAMLSELWGNVRELSAGGAVSGSLSEVFLWLFGKAGAAAVLICATLFLLLSAFNKTIAGIVDAIRNRERREYEPEPEMEPQSAPLRPNNTKKSATSPKRKKGIDIPLDGDERPPVPDYFSDPPKEGFFKGAPRVKTPDQLIAEYAPEDAEPEPEPVVDTVEEVQEEVQEEAQEENQEEIEDLPLDISFMENRRGGSKAAPPQAKKEPKTEEPEAAPPEDDREELIEPIKTDPEAVYTFPPLDLLSVGEKKAHAAEDEVRVNSERLEAAFQSFGVNVNIMNATRGPAVTRYEAELEAGVKLSKLTGLEDDIALSLGTSGVRIAAMPNKISTVGIEVPNKKISAVHLRDIIESQNFSQAKSKLTFAIGMDISGEAIVGDVSKLPHMLIAGTTGSGKSVCMNSIILSILYKAAPEDVRFIMIDPKMVEFKVYNNIPHLLVPVVTDVKKAAGALQWAVFEMMKRYALFSETNARDLEGYNQIVRNSKKKAGMTGNDADSAVEDKREPLPQIVVVIDELADLMMTAAKEVEESVCRVAQMGRAAGMHLVIATQSPRADVLTGLMKANIPSRIAFKVSSKLESRIILDSGSSADKLVGNGDMLYAPTGTMKHMRVQGTWVSDKEREKVVDYVKRSGETQYSEEVMGEIEKAAVEKSSGGKQKDEQEGSDHDELLPQAVDVIFETGQASVSMLQRRLKLGYSRAARIVDQMEQMGIVGPFEGSKPREVLITKEQWRQMQVIEGTAPTDSVFPDPLTPASDDE